MTQTAINYARALYELGISRESMQMMTEIIEEVPKLAVILKAPVVSREEKHRVIEQVFPAETKSFLKLLCDYDRAEQLEQVCAAYEMEYRNRNKIIEARVTSAVLLTQEKKQDVQRFIQEKYPDQDCRISYRTEETLLGGTVIRVGNMEYDNSYAGRLHQLELKLTGR